MLLQDKKLEIKRGRLWKKNENTVYINTHQK